MYWTIGTKIKYGAKVIYSSSHKTRKQEKKLFWTVFKEANLLTSTPEAQ